MTERWQEFTSPGTWTNPGDVTSVEVWVVAGGGGGGGPSSSYGGGGGAVRRAVLPIDGPAPVVVGAGGGTATIGGTSSFNAGPTGLSADGGQGADSGVGSALPPIGGGGGSSSPAAGSGALGYPGGSGSAIGGGGMGGSVKIDSLNQGYGPTGPANGITIPYYGPYLEFGAGGGAAGYNPDAGLSSPGGATPTYPARANSGGGGAGARTSGSGVVLVHWWE